MAQVCTLQPAVKALLGPHLTAVATVYRKGFEDGSHSSGAADSPQPVTSAMRESRPQQEVQERNDADAHQESRAERVVEKGYRDSFAVFRPSGRG
ncbi:hypothetical protein [Streptomyces himalayensis]|uniref:Uncharacterized protein n=1 Tax=Streptomyces himalayensis subsp. himalayensis TaxID=2756131 RepID=A0A7W0DIB8_9ACTN|nr:hypothetical protein [Streptomyces himalayensis]MBA2945644.1 hypothetical protein [Streptomyces himalayensis subsp. himalayensis]